MQPQPGQHPTSGHYRSTSKTPLAFRLQADSDQILHASSGDGIEPTIFGMIKQSQALNIETLH